MRTGLLAHAVQFWEQADSGDVAIVLAVIGGVLFLIGRGIWGRASKEG